MQVLTPDGWHLRDCNGNRRTMDFEMVYRTNMPSLNVADEVFLLDGRFGVLPQILTEEEIAAFQKGA